MEDGNVGAAMLGTVVPAAFTVALLSTPRLRRQWDFRILVFALCVLLVRSILQIATSAKGTENGGNAIVYTAIWGNMYLTLGFMAQFLSWICDCAILCRVLAFHPSTTTPQRKRFSIMAFPLAAHLPRVPLIVATVAYTTLEGYQSNRFKHIYTPLRVVEGGLQMVVNCYCSGCLLHKAHQYAQADFSSQSPQASRARLRLRYLTESVLFTFVPASLSQLGSFVASVIALFAPYNEETIVLNALGYLRLVNILFGVHFGLLAVWWSLARTRITPAFDQSASAQSVKSKADMSFLEWALGPIEPEVDRTEKLKAITQAKEMRGQPPSTSVPVIQFRRSIPRM